MPTDDLISVISSAYNHEKYIEECIRSIMAQTYRNIELLVIDDGSTDGTFEKLMKVKPECEKRFARVVFETQKNQGVHITLNRLLDQTQGKYIYLIDSDDTSKLHGIKTLHSFLSQNPDYVLAVGDNEIINGHSERIYWGDYRKVLPEKEAIFKTVGDELHINEPNNNHPKFGNYADLLKGNYVPNGCLVRKSAFFKTGKYNPNILLEDWYIFLLLSKQGKFKYIPEILYSYRWHESNTMQNPDFQNRSLEIYHQIYEHEKEYCFTHGYKKQWKKLWEKKFGWKAEWKKIRRTLKEKICDFIKGKKANTTLITLQIHGDDRGSLIALENGHNLPFDVKRVYYIFGTKPGIVRGHHAHKKLKQLLIAMSGSVTIKCEYNGQQKEYTLSRPDEGLLIEGLVWREMHNFSPDCVLMVLADEHYNENDYIRDYRKFLNMETDK